MALFSQPLHDVLPTELIIEITDALFANKTWSWSPDIVRLSSVDRAMREIVLARPTYWTNLFMDQSPSSATFANLCLERSKNEPLTLEIIFLSGLWPSHMEDILRVLVQSAPRLKALTIVMNTINLLQTFRTLLPRLRMPNLAKLFIDYDTLFHGGADRNRDITFPKASNLKDLSLVGVVPPLPIKSRPYSKLTSLRFGAGTMFAWSTEIMAQIVLHATNLEELLLEGCDTILTADQFEWTHDLLCPNVRRLNIVNADTPFFVQTLLHLHAPLLESVKLSEPAQSTNHQDPVDWNALDFKAHPNVRSLIIYRLESSPKEAQAAEDFGRCAILAFPNITHLEIGTSGSWILEYWPVDGNHWLTLETLKIHGSPVDAGAEPDASLAAALDFVKARKWRAECQQIKHLSLDTSRVRRKVGAEQIIGKLRAEVENVAVGEVKMTPWKP